MRSEIEAGGGRIDDIFYCPHRPDENCSCRKPKTLMGEMAAEKYGIDLKGSYMIGDSDADMGFGERLGCKSIRIRDGFSFEDAVDSILK
jgi:histidinol-phosphate phosphatase family protein